MVIKNKRPERRTSSQEVGLSDEIWDIMRTCWDPEPSNRPKIGDIVALLSKAQGITDPDEIPPKSRPTPLLTDGNEVLEVSHNICSRIHH
jgi:hypothetical protein